MAAWHAGFVLGLMLTSLAALAQPKAEKGIYTCIDDRGRRLTADRPIPECSGKEQQILNQDGSVRAIVPPTLTPRPQSPWRAQAWRRRGARRRSFSSRWSKPTWACLLYTSRCV